MEQSITHPVMYVNPMIDVAFKYLFGTEKHKNLLKGLLEHVFGREIEDINYDNTEQISDFMAEGREKGLAEGRAEERQEIVRSLLANGASYELIARSLKITVDEVKELAAN